MLTKKTRLVATAAASLLAAPLVALALAPPSPGAAMADAAAKLSASWTDEQKKMGVFTLDEAHRSEWYFIPKPDRHGVPLKKMDAKQRELAHALLKTGLSAAGYTKTTQIMELEKVLAEMEKDPVKRDPELYFFSIYGTPAAKGSWGWRAEGHHVSLNFTIVKGTMVVNLPQFYGSNPGEVREGPLKGRRVLKAEEDLGRHLLQALDDKQKAKAVFAKEAFKDIITMNQPKVEPLKTEGLPAKELKPAQVAMLKALLEQYTSSMPAALAAERMGKVKKLGYDKLWFGWAGGPNRGDPHYYRVQGPTFIVEYDNTQNNANHIHAVWRDYDGDFGRDLLREHLKAAH